MSEAQNDRAEKLEAFVVSCSELDPSEWVSMVLAVHDLGALSQQEALDLIRLGVPEK